MKKMEVICKPSERADLLIERDAGNPILILFGKKEYALPAWEKLRGLCNEAILNLKQGERWTTIELINAVKNSNIPSQPKQQLIESLEQWAEENL